MNKRGQAGTGGMWLILIWAGLAILLVLIVVMSITDSSGKVLVVLGDAPTAAELAIQFLYRIAKPVTSGIFWLVSPADPCAGFTGTCNEENVQMIAFAIFLLLTLVGTKTLRPFIRGPFLAFFISLIIGLIAGRSLTATILEESALAASPIAAVSLIIGFLPVFALTRNIDRWGLNQGGKMVVFTVAGFVYIVIFWLVFNSRLLGLIYGGGIVLLGAVQLILPYYSVGIRKRKGQKLGQYMSTVRSTIETAEAMEEGALGAGERV